MHARSTHPARSSTTTPIGIDIPNVCTEWVRKSAPNGPASGRSPTRRSARLVMSRSDPADQVEVTIS
jgi:hypothetical protein